MEEQFIVWMWFFSHRKWKNIVMFGPFIKTEPYYSFSSLFLFSFITDDFILLEFNASVSLG